jgi:hypothetical protein
MSYSTVAFVSSISAAAHVGPRDSTVARSSPMAASIC